MRNFSKILTIAAISAASTVAFANRDGFHHHHRSIAHTSCAHEGFIAGIDGGYGYLSTHEATYPNDYIVIGANGYKYSSSTDAGDFVWGVHTGYDIKVKPNTLVGLELGYKDLGHTLAKIAYQVYAQDIYDLLGSRKHNQSAVDLLLTSSHYIYKGLHVVGKIGAAYVNADVTQSATSDTGTTYSFTNIPLTAGEGNSSIWRIEPELSLGFGYTFHNHMDIHAAYTYIGGANDQPMVDPINMPFLPKARVYSTNLLMVGVSYTF